MSVAHDELLRPVLTEADDAAGLRRPFRPPSLVLATFFGGAFCAAILFAWNWRELGRPRAARLAAVLFAALGVVLPLMPLAMAEYGWLPLDPDDLRLVRFAVRATPVLPALFVARAQRRRFRLFEAGGGEARPALAPALGAVLIGMVLSSALVWGARELTMSSGGGRFGWREASR
jgi:hypothetical protein